MKPKYSKYGEIIYDKQKKLFQVYFWNPFEQKNEIIKASRKEKKAKIYLNSLNYSFFSRNPQFLPEGIGIDRKDKMFTFTISMKDEKIYMFQSDYLDEVVNFKFEFTKQFFN